jgi:pimeloyl-ACP methyl ester carboxylesterase
VEHEAGEVDPNAKLPLLMFVYGEPHGQTVRDAWPGVRGLWHWMLAQQGFVVASVDNRGTNLPRGREWRKSVHRKIGILAPTEQAAAVRVLLQRWPFVDPARVGSWGWSGGGSMTLNALFRHPDLYLGRLKSDLIGCVFELDGKDLLEITLVGDVHFSWFAGTQTLGLHLRLELRIWRDGQHQFRFGELIGIALAHNP